MAKVSDVNVDCSVYSVCQAFFSLKELLVGSCGWSMVYSSDGTTHSASDNVTTVALLSQSNAYYVISDPSGIFWFYYQRTYDNSIANIAISRVAPQANGTATGMPTCANAADAYTVVGNGYPFNTTAGAKVQIVAYDAAENAAGVFPFYMLYTQGNATLLGSMFFEAMTDDTYGSNNTYPYAFGLGQYNYAVEANDTWVWFHMPTSSWTAGSRIGIPYTSVPIAGAGTCGVDPWDSVDRGLPLMFGRGSSQSSPGFLGVAKNMRLRGVARNYPDTMTTLSSETFVYAGYCLVPYADGGIPQ